MKKSHENNGFNISSATWHGKFKLPDGSNLVSDIQYYFEFIIKKHEILTDIASIQNISYIKSRTTFK